MANNANTMLGKFIFSLGTNKNVPSEVLSFSKEERVESVRTQLFEILELDINNFTAKEVRKAIRKHKVEVYEIWEEVVDSIIADKEFMTDKFYTQFCDTRNLALGDTNIFYVDTAKQLEVVEFSGSHFSINRQRKDIGQSFSVPVRDFGIAVYEYFERIASGRCDFAQLIVETGKAMERKLVDMAKSTFTAALSALPGDFKKTTGTYDKDAIIAICEKVKTANGGDMPVIVGTGTGLRKLQGYTADAMYSDDMKNERNQNGLLGRWEGYTCIEIENAFDPGTFNYIIPSNDIYILSGDNKLVKVVIEGDTEVKSISDQITNADKTLQETLTFKAGAAVAFGGMVGWVQFS